MDRVFKDIIPSTSIRKAVNQHWTTSGSYMLLSSAGYWPWRFALRFLSMTLLSVRMWAICLLPYCSAVCAEWFSPAKYGCSHSLYFSLLPWLSSGSTLIWSRCLGWRITDSYPFWWVEPFPGWIFSATQLAVMPHFSWIALFTKTPKPI